MDLRLRNISILRKKDLLKLFYQAFATYDGIRECIHLNFNLDHNLTKPGRSRISDAENFHGLKEQAYRYKILNTNNFF